MKTLTRNEVREEFNKIVAQYGNPKAGKIYCKDQLIAKIVHDLGGFNTTNITYEYGAFEVSPNLCISNEYAPDHKFIGTVKADEWFTKEQLMALHELWYGYQF